MQWDLSEIWICSWYFLISPCIHIFLAGTRRRINKVFLYILLCNQFGILIPCTCQFHMVNVYHCIMLVFVLQARSPLKSSMSQCAMWLNGHTWGRAWASLQLMTSFQLSAPMLYMHLQSSMLAGTPLNVWNLNMTWRTIMGQVGVFVIECVEFPSSLLGCQC